MRLQQTYDLSPATMSDGIAPDVPSTTRMSADDTYALGKAAYGNRDFHECELWMKETLRLLDIGRVQGVGPSRFDVLDFLSYSEYTVKSLNMLFSLFHFPYNRDLVVKERLKGECLYVTYFRGKGLCVFTLILID